MWVSGIDTVLTAGQDINFTAQGTFAAVVAKGIALYVQGGEPPAGRPVKRTGIALAAATGKTRVQAQQDQASFAAEQAITVSSSERSVSVQAKQYLLMTAAGAYLKLARGNIEIGAPGNAFFKGSQRELAGPLSASASQVTLARAKAEACAFAAGAADASGSAKMGAG